jgi:hypothetical protein
MIMLFFKKTLSYFLFSLSLIVSVAGAQTLKITGLPVNIGDTVEQVQQAMQTAAVPTPYESKINPNGTRLSLGHFYKSRSIRRGLLV